MRLSTTALFAIAALAGAACTSAPAQVRARDASGIRLGIASLVTLPNADCGTMGSSTKPPCEGGAPYQVQVFYVLDTAGKVAACVSSFPYQNLTVHTSKALQAATITWQILGPFGAPTTAVLDAFFVSGGIYLDGKYGSKVDDLFKQPPTKVDTASHKVEGFVKEGAAGGLKFDHKPIVAMTVDGTVLGCQGIDPVFVNSAD